MKVTVLILNIICAILFGIGALINALTATGIIYLIATIIWSVNVGMSISRLIEHKHSENER